MADVFISYSREDRARAEQVARGLEGVGLNVFWDSEIPPGQTWADYIEGKLSQCKAVVVLWSQHSTRSQWVREEARMGRDKGKLIPVMIDASQAPFGFGEVQAADLSAWQGAANDPNWQRVVEAVRSATNASATPRPAMSAPPRRAPEPKPEREKKSVPPWVWIGGTVVATVVVLGIIGANLPDDPVPAPTPVEQTLADVPVDPAPAPAQQPALTQADYEAHIMARLGEMQQALGSQGFQQIGQPTVNALRTGQTQDIPADLMVGYEYRIAGVCDQDCGDLDLTLFDGLGNAISQDTSVDNRPVVPVLVTSSGRFTVRVLMYACNVEPCYYATVLYGRPAG